MDFKEFLPLEKEENKENEAISEKFELKEKISPNQIYDVITSKKHDWYDIIYELIYSEQLDPWDIDLVLLTRRYFEKISELEEEDFYISSKVLLAAALLLRIKSEFLLNKHIKSIDEILFGKKQETKYAIEKIEIDENELPVLIPKTPLARLKKVTLDELMSALNKAINTETRRIKKEVAIKNAKKISEADFPRFQRIDLKNRIRQFYAKILTFIKKKSKENEKHLNKVCYSHLVGKEREEKLACFLPLLHLSNSKKLWLEQENHLGEIWIYLYKYFDKNRDKFIEDLEEDIEEMKEELGMSPEVGENLDELEKLNAMEKIVHEIKKEKLKEKNKRLREESNELSEEKNELSEEADNIKKEEKIDKITGFDDERF